MSKIVSLTTVVKIVDSMFGDSLHFKRRQSLAFAAYGAALGERLGSAWIGRALARARGGSPKHGIKQVDRLVGNKELNVQHCLGGYVGWLVGQRKEIVVSLDWTEYAKSGHSRIAVNLVTTHGRATPLVWKTVRTAGLKGRRGGYERQALELLSQSLPGPIKVIVLADRGFADIDFYEFIYERLNWNFVIRFKSGAFVTTSAGPFQKAHEWVACNGQITQKEDAYITRRGYLLPGSVVCVKKKDMKEPWILATSLHTYKERVVNLYAKRFTCEEQFRDEKDDRFGAAFGQTKASATQRRDRLLLIHAIATLVLTLLGAAGERIGYDRRLKANTAPRRTHSLYRQGKEYIRGVMAKYERELQRILDSLIESHNNLWETFAIV